MHSIVAWGWGLLALGLAPAADPGGQPPPTHDLPSVAVLGLSAKQGVHADAAELLTENLVQGLRRTGRFSRVTSASDLQTVMSFEIQKQLLDCDSTSCVAELAGALGVEYIVAGSLGRLGETWVFNARLIRVSNATAEGAVSQPIEGATEAVLLKAVDPIVTALLQTSKVPPAPGQKQAPVQAAGPGMGAVTGWVVSGLGVASGVLSLAVVVLGSVAAAGTWVLFNFVPGFAPYQAPMQAVIVVGVAALVLGAVVLVPSVGAGVAGILASIFLG